jgi:hypothetical protein
MTIPTGLGGVFFTLVGNFAFAAAATGTIRSAILRKNGTTIIAQQDEQGIINAGLQMEVGVQIVLADGDYVEVLAFQDSVGSVNVQAGATFSIVRQGGPAGAAGATGATGGAGSGGALIFLEAHTASNSATLDFTTFISSTYDEYVFEFVNIIPVTSDVGFRMQMGTGGGPTYDTGANYGWNVFIARAGGTGQNGGDTGQTFIQFTYGSSGTLGLNNSANYGYSGQCRLFGPQSAIYKQVTGQGRYYDAEPFVFATIMAGTYISATAVTAIRFLMSSGNIASGIIRVYGIAKS